MGRNFIVNFPEIGEGVYEGEIIEWLKKEGEELAQDEPVVVVMTDKATVELPAPMPGKLAKQHYQPGQIALRDAPLYEIELAQEFAAPKIAEEKKPDREVAEENVMPSERERNSQSIEHLSVSSTKAGHTLAIPQVRHMAKELGIDLETIEGTGKRGRITVSDLNNQKKSLSNKHTDVLHLSDDDIVQVIGIKKLMAKKMAESKANIPHFSYFESADATRLIQLKEVVNAEAQTEGMHLTYMPFIIRALSFTIKAFPMLNSSYNAETSELYIHHQHNIGIAMSTPLGLIVPVLKNVESLDLSQIIHVFDELVERGHKSKLQSTEMKEATITISNFGTAGHGKWATPIINHPEVAILALARVHQEPVVKNENVVIGNVINLSWSFDHRVIDGTLAVLVSDYFCKLIQNPAQLL